MNPSALVDFISVIIPTAGEPALFPKQPKNPPFGPGEGVLHVQQESDELENLVLRQGTKEMLEIQDMRDSKAVPECH